MPTTIDPSVIDAAVIDQGRDALLLIDMQPDFMEGGALAVGGGRGLVDPVNALMSRFRHVVATQDWHPPGHKSFASAHPGRKPMDQVELPYGPQTLWPDHCVAGTPGAALHPNLDQARIRAVIRKGVRPDVDSYSGFWENDRTTPTGLAGYLRTLGVERVWLAGLTTDFCVAATACDARALGFETTVLLGLCRGIAAPVGTGRTTLDDARERMLASGVVLDEVGIH